jgi:hypothetical protein
MHNTTGNPVFGGWWLRVEVLTYPDDIVSGDVQREAEQQSHVSSGLESLRGKSLSLGDEGALV